MGNILRRTGLPLSRRGAQRSSWITRILLRGTCLCLPPNRLATLSTEADLELAYCCTSTPVPLRARGRQERISA